MSGPYNYYLGPWEWVDDEAMPGWNPPNGTIGLVDLRGIPDQSLKGTLGDKPIGFFAVDVQQTLNSDYSLLGTGDLREIPVTLSQRDTWGSLLGYRPTEGTYLVDLLWEQLTQGGDPSGDNPTSPLMPTTKGRLEIHLAGHSVIKKEGYRHGKHRHTSKVEDVLKRNFKKAFGKGSKKEEEHSRKVLDYWLEKYKLSPDEKSQDWKRFVPPELRRHIPGPKKHSTTIAESFDGADSSSQLGYDNTWDCYLSVGTGYYNGNNRARVSLPSTVIRRIARCDSDLSGDDMYSQVVTKIVSNSSVVQQGTLVRVDSSSRDTCYTHFWNKSDGLSYLYKWVSGSGTSLVSGSSFTLTANDVLRLEVNGSSLESFRNGGTLVAATDTAITGNTRGGLYGYNNSGVGNEMDDFEVADLAVGGSTFSPIYYNTLLAGST